jgi:hypothetical protein
VCDTDHALAAAGLAATLSQQAYHAECVPACEKAIALLSSVESESGIDAVTLATMQSLSFSLEVLGKIPEAIVYVVMCACICWFP